MDAGGAGGGSPGAECSRKESLTRGKCSTAGASGLSGSRNRWHSRGWRCSSGLGEMGGNGIPCSWQNRPRSCSCCKAGGEASERLAPRAAQRPQQQADWAWRSLDTRDFMPRGQSRLWWTQRSQARWKNALNLTALHWAHQNGALTKPDTATGRKDPSLDQQGTQRCRDHPGVGSTNGAQM